MADLKPPVPELNGVNPDDWPNWLRANAGRLSDESLLLLSDWVDEQDLSKNSESWVSDLRSVIAGPVTQEASTRQLRREGQAETEVEGAITTGRPVDPDVNNDGKVTPEERAEAQAATTRTTSQVRTAAEQQAKAEGATDEQARQAADSAGSAIDDLISGAKPIPPILQQYITATNGKPTPEQVKSLIEAWNTLNPLAPVTNEDELYDRLAAGGASGGPVQKQVIEVGLLGAEPIIDYRIPTIDGQSYTVSAATFELLNREFGYTTAEMTSAVRSASRAGLTDGRGEPAWQVLLGLANATRQRSALTPLDDPSREGVDDARRQLQAEIDAGRYAGRAEQEYEGSVSDGGYTRKVRTPRNPFGGSPIDEAKRAFDAETANANAAGVATASQNYTSSQNLQNLAAQFSAGRSLYGGDDMLGLLQVVDPSLAARVAVTDPGKLSLDDQRKAAEIFLDVGLSPDQLAALGYAWTSNFDGSGQRAGGGGGSAQRAMPDPAALRQAATDLYRSLYAADPTEAQLVVLTGAVTSAIASAPDNQSIDPNARLRAAAEALPEHGTFYGNKPAGMSDAEYRAQFDQGAAAILGTTAATSATIQGGLRTGRVQTAVGAAAAQKSAWDSSTWMGRLAAAAQQVSELT